MTGSILDQVHDQLSHLQLDRADTIVGPAGAALFSPPGGPADTTTAPDGRAYRYALHRTWRTDLPTAVFLMLNPSTADAFQLDPTLRRCLDFASRWGCGSMTILNVFGLRATKPKFLTSHPDPVGPDNDQVIAAVLHARGNGPVVAAWGTNPALRGTGRPEKLMALLDEQHITPVCLVLTSGGHPQHPLYVPALTTPVPFQLRTGHP